MKKCLLSDDIALISGQHLNASDLSTEKSGHPYLTGPTDFLNGRPNPSRWTEKGRAFCESGDILVVVKGSGTGASYVADARYALGRQLMAVRPKSWNPNFIRQIISANARRYQSLATGLIPGISRDDILNTPSASLRLPEQRKIADILSTWDEALETLDALIAAKDRQKQALMQQLLTGKTRVKGAKGKWKKIRFGEWLTESRITGTDGSNAKKITVKLHGRGVYPKQDRVVGSENTKYYVRKAGQFIYSKLDFLNGAFGVVPESLDGYESTLDLPSFDVSPNADAKWLLFYVTRSEFYTQQLGAAAGGRKARRVNPSEFLAMKILAPDLTEQRQIAAILDTADQELLLLRTQRQTLDQQKRGLMQRLLTGKIRVKP